MTGVAAVDHESVAFASKKVIQEEIVPTSLIKTFTFVVNVSKEIFFLF